MDNDENTFKEEEPKEKSVPKKRMKVPLKKGFTLADWASLVRSGKNLSGVSGKPGFITVDEVYILLFSLKSLSF